MFDKHLELLVNIEKELSTNTEATKGIKEQLMFLNGKVAKNSKDISWLKKTLLVVGAVAGTLLITNGSELIGFLIKII